MRKANLGAAAYAYPKMIVAKMVFVRFGVKTQIWGQLPQPFGQPWQKSTRVFQHFHVARLQNSVSKYDFSL